MRPDLTPFAERRQHFLDALDHGIAVVPAAHETLRNGDVSHEFRQDSDFYFLTGFTEPRAVAVFDAGHATERFLLFVRPRDPEREMWDGRRAGVEGAERDFGADRAYPLGELDQVLRERTLGHRMLHCRLGNPAFDSRITALLEYWRGMRRLGHATPRGIHDPTSILAELRLVKSKADLERLRRACRLGAEGHREAMRFAAPGVWEYQVQAALEFVFRAGGSPRNGYPSIVASGPNACILHYGENSRRMQEGDLLLIDAGCEHGHFTADITRTFPVSGRFSAPQRRVYEIVLAAQQAAIAAARPGARFEAMHDAARLKLTEGLAELGLLPVGVEDSLRMHLYREFYPHGTGHWLGMDVHDTGDYKVERRSRLLEPGMVVTVEPGLYFGPERDSVTFHLREYDDVAERERRVRLGVEEARKLERQERDEAPKREHPVPEAYRGIGIRIEDDVLITEEGAEVLTGAVPRQPDEVEGCCAEPTRLPRQASGPGALVRRASKRASKVDGM